MIKFLARDAEAGRIGTYQTSFTVPNLNREETQLPISTVVLGSQRVPLGDRAVQREEHDRRRDARAPARLRRAEADAQRDARVQHQSAICTSTCRPTSAAATTTQPLVAFVTFYRDDAKVFETQPLAIVDGLDPRVEGRAGALQHAARGLPPGRYDCQVTVLEPTGQKAAFWRAPVVIVP